MPDAAGPPRLLDSTDLQLLRLLQEDGRTSNVDLARAVSLSPAPCLRRVQRLEEEGIIRRYVALVDAGALGHAMNVFISVRLERQTKEVVDRFEHEIQRLPEVLECYWMAGENDYLLRVSTADLLAYERLLMNHLTRIDGVANIQSSITMRQVKYSTALPVDTIGVDR